MHAEWPADFRCLLAGEEVAPQLLQPLADPLELGDADACNVEVVGLKAHL